MALERGQQLSRGSRRTQVESSFGVVKTQANTLGTSLSNLTQTVDKVNQFQVDIMDKEWQNDFDTNSALFIENETRRELNSPNPDIIGLREKFISYRQKSLETAPKRFSNYIENKLDINYASQINNVKDYANDLRFNNLVASNANLNELNLNTTANLIEKIIKDNPGDLEKQRQLIDLHFLNNVTPNLITQENGNKLLHELKPLEVTPGLIAEDLRDQMLNYETLNQSAVIQGIMSKTNFESGEIADMSLQLKNAEIEIDNYIEDYMKNPDVRRVKDMSPDEVTTLASNLKTVKNNLLSVQSDKINKIQAVDNYTTKKIVSNYPLQFVANVQLALESTEGSIIFNAINDPVIGPLLSQQPAAFASVIANSIEAMTIHKFLNEERGEVGSENNYLGNKNDLIEKLKERHGIVIESSEFDDYIYANIGGSINLTASEFVNNMIEFENADPNLLINYGNQTKMIGGEFDKALGNKFKTTNQIQEERSNILNYRAIKANIQNGYLPSGTGKMINNVDAIMAKSTISQKEIIEVRNTIDYLNLIRRENPDILFEQYIDNDIPTFLGFLEMSRGGSDNVYTGLNLVDIEGGEALQAEYRDFLKKPYDLNKVKTYLSDNELDVTSGELSLKTVDDLTSQMGSEALVKWIANLGDEWKIGGWSIKGRSEGNKWNKTNNFSEIFGGNIPGWKKILVGLSEGYITKDLYGGKKSESTYNIVIPENVKAQFNDVFVLELKQQGVDFSLVGNNDEKFNKQINKVLSDGRTVREAAMDLAAKKLNRDGFSLSSYEQMGYGSKLVNNSIESQIPYLKQKDKDIYVATHFFQKIKNMENEKGIEKMKDTYPNLYFTNVGSSTQNEVKFDLERAYDLAIKKNGLYFIKQPGTNAYSYNLNPEVFVGSNSYSLAGDIDDEQFFTVTDTITADNGKLISTEGIIGEAIQTYIKENSNVIKFMKSRNIDSEIMESLLYSVYLPGVRLLTTKKDILKHIEKNGFNLE